MEWLKRNLLALFAPKYIGSIVRTLLAILAGYLLKLGIPQAQIDVLLKALDPVLLGVITAGGTAFWSLVQKSNSQSK